MIRDFWAADHDIEWTAIEQEHYIWLSDNTLLVGRVDAQGLNTSGASFFGEWKTASANKARYMADTKAAWRMDPQSLTYGVLLGGATRQFTVRWALKTTPVQTDFEWYTYSEAEVQWWRTELLDIATQIRHRRLQGKANWPTNLTNCLRYGKNYACPFIESCHRQQFTVELGQPREPHLEVERKILPIIASDVVILDATRTEVWLECSEKYRRTYESLRPSGGRGFSEQSEALQTGKEFHDIYGAHLQLILDTKKGKEDGRTGNFN